MSSNFLVFNPGALNQESDSTYNGDSLRAGGIVLNAILPHVLLNKLFYQNSIMTASLAGAMAGKGYSPNDGNANPTLALTNLTSILANIITQADLDKPNGGVFPARMPTGGQLTAPLVVNNPPPSFGSFWSVGFNAIPAGTMIRLTVGFRCSGSPTGGGQGNILFKLTDMLGNVAEPGGVFAALKGANDCAVVNLDIGIISSSIVNFYLSGHVRSGGAAGTTISTNQSSPFNITGGGSGTWTATLQISGNSTGQFTFDYYTFTFIPYLT